MSAAQHEAEMFADVKGQIESYENVAQEARKGTEMEQRMTFMEGVRRYPKAMAWSILLSTAVVMEGFDLTLLSNFYALDQFKAKYGEMINGEMSITAAWQAGLSNGAIVGEIIGLALNGWASERFGYRMVMIVALTAMTLLIFIPFFAVNIEMLLVAEILQGIPWGVFQTLTTAYASEVTPVALRPYLTAYVNLCWVFGQLIASGVLRGVLSWDSEWAYRVPFALQWVWPVPILIGCIFAPESPWWLVRKGRYDDARKTIYRLNTNPDDVEVEATLSMMIHTNALEKAMTAGTSYWDCFKGVDLRRTEIAAGVWMVQNLCGSAFMGYSTYFLESAGLAASNAFSLTIGQYAIGICGTVSSWLLMARFGRRKLYLVGLVGMFVLLVVIGGMGFISEGNSSAQWAIGGMLLAYTAIYDGTVGPVCYCLVAEISSTRLRSKTVVVARVAYNLIGIVNSIIMPYFLNPGELNWGGKTGLFWAGLCFICIVWTYFRVPEPKGRTYGELDMLFEQRIAARKFSSTDVDQYAAVSEAVGATGGRREDSPVFGDEKKLEETYIDHA